MPHRRAIFLTTLVTWFNLITFLRLLNIINKVGILLIIVGPLLYLLYSWYFEDKYETIINDFNKEKLRTRVIGNILVTLFIVASSILFIKVQSF
jgi:hypothetical protein